MSNTLRFTLRTISYPLKHDILKLKSFSSTQTCRYLYVKAAMGLDGFDEQRRQTKNQMLNIETKFRERMRSFTVEDSSTMIFTEDLKNMIHLAENDDDFDLVVKMAKKFNGQNKQLRFGNFVFGPVLMRLFHTYSKPDLALECFNSPQLEGFFDQLITYQIFLDLLYENGRYSEMLDVFETIKSRQLEAAKYPRNAVVLVMAACYKLNSEKSTEYALNLWNELMAAGHFPMRRAMTFCAGLVLNQGKPELVLEILASVKNPNYVTIRNLKAKALSQIGRVEEAVFLLKSVISSDQPGEVTQTFNREVVEYVKAAVEKLGNPELSLEFSKLEKLFEKEGHIADSSLDSHLCSEIQKPPVLNNRQVNRFSRYSPGHRRDSDETYNRPQRRPGLSDMV